MADVTLWYIALLAGAAIMIFGARSIYKVRRQMRLGVLSASEGKEGEQ